MKSITPAALAALRNNDIENFIVAATPGGIEAQEAHGQQQFVKSASGYQSCDADGNPIEHPNPHTHFATVIQDGGKTIRVIGVREDSDEGRTLRDAHSAAANMWLDENYPDWKDRTAYWDVEK